MGPRPEGGVAASEDQFARAVRDLCGSPREVEGGERCPELSEDEEEGIMHARAARGGRHNLLVAGSGPRELQSARDTFRSSAADSAGCGTTSTLLGVLLAASVLVVFAMAAATAPAGASAARPSQALPSNEEVVLRLPDDPAEEAAVTTSAFMGAHVLENASTLAAITSTEASTTFADSSNRSSDDDAAYAQRNSSAEEATTSPDEPGQHRTAESSTHRPRGVQAAANSSSPANSSKDFGAFEAYVHAGLGSEAFAQKAEDDLPQKVVVGTLGAPGAEENATVLSKTDSDGDAIADESGKQDSLRSESA